MDLIKMKLEEASRSNILKIKQNKENLWKFIFKSKLTNCTKKLKYYRENDNMGSQKSMQNKIRYTNTVTVMISFPNI